MFKKSLAIFTLAICGLMTLQAMETIPSNQLEMQQHQDKLAGCQKCKRHKKGKRLTVACEDKDLTPGVLVCNSSEGECLKEINQAESASSILFAVFCEDRQDEMNLLACKDCR